MMNKKYKNAFVYLGIFVLGMGTVYIMGDKPKDEMAQNMSTTLEIKEEEHQVYTCSMHPHIHSDEPGNCPICGMALVEIYGPETDDNHTEILMSKAAIELAEIETSVVGKEIAKKEIRLDGRVEVNDRLVFSQTVHIEGRIEKLLINYPGEYVEKGQIIAYIYSPELITAQKELLEAHRMRLVEPRLFAAARVKLKNWKLEDVFIDEVISNGVINEFFPIISDFSGVITRKNINQGDYVNSGFILYNIADLSNLWVNLDLYEQDIVWVALGNRVQLSIPAYPEMDISGIIDFIAPAIDPITHVSRVRVEVQNKRHLLKPNMRIYGKIESLPNGMDKVIVVPKSAVIWTGEHSLVYVKTKEKMDYISLLVTYFWVRI